MFVKATTHSFLLSPDPHDHAHAPPSSPSFQMPNVFVFPPEEEQSQNPPWCCFSAAQDTLRDLSTPPDFNSLDLALKGLDDTTPAFRRSMNDEFSDIIMPTKAAERKMRDQEVVEYEERVFHPPVGAGNDSIVVEVVKVRKSDVLTNVGAVSAPTMKRSKTFKYRASKAFQSIKNVGKGSTRKKSAKEIWPSDSDQNSSGRPSSSPHEEIGPLPNHQARNRTLSRGGLTTLSQLFQAPNDTSTTDVSPAISPSEPEFPPLSYTNLSSPSSSICTVLPDTLFHFDDQTSRSTAGESRTDLPEVRAPSPALSTTKSFRQRFSVIDLIRFFSFSSNTPPLSSSCATSTTSSSPTISLSRGVSSSSEIGPETPTEDKHPYSDKVAPVGWSKPIDNVTVEGAETLPDLSFDMKLNSLHFDSLSFDPEAF
jgi:hypothetical protein